MKIVHISTSLNGGAGRAAFRIHEALLKNGVDSTFVSLDYMVDSGIPRHDRIIKDSKQNSIFKVLKDKIDFRLRKHLGIGLNGKRRIENEFEKIHSKLDCEIATLPFSEYDILKIPAVEKADIIHLHWVSGILDFPSFFKKNKKPVVWTFHDMNPFQGIFHYKEDQARNSQVAKKIDKRVFDLKKKCIRKRHFKLSIVTPSQWLLEDTKNSKMFLKVNAELILYPINISFFSPRLDPLFKRESEVPEKNIILLFVAHYVKIHRKGFDLLKEALTNSHEKNITLLILGNTDEVYIEDIDTKKLGPISDHERLSYYYSNADAFILPSREDNLPLVMMESLACGTPVIGFPVGGIGENIVDYENGLLAEKVNCRSLADTIENFCKNRDRFNSEKISENAKAKFNEHLIALKYLEVYKKSIQESV